MEGKRQGVVIDFIQDCIMVAGFPPTSREILEHFGFASQTAAMGHLRALERKGASGKARAVVPAQSQGAISKNAAVGRVARVIPLHGCIAAGMPTDAVEDTGERIAVDADLLRLPRGCAGVFGLRVRADSITGAHILDGARKFFGHWFGCARRCRLQASGQGGQDDHKALRNVITYLSRRVTTAATEGLTSIIQSLRGQRQGLPVVLKLPPPYPLLREA